MNGIKTGLGITPGEHIISAASALSRNIRHCFCLSCRGRLILQTDAQGAWFEHDLHALSAQQKAACVVLNPEYGDVSIAITGRAGVALCDVRAAFSREKVLRSLWHGDLFQSNMYEVCLQLPARLVSGLRRREYLIQNPRSAQGVQRYCQPVFYPVFRSCPVRDTTARHRISAVLLT